MKKTTVDEIICTVTISLLFISLLLITTLAHCSTTEDHKNGLGVSEVSYNPYSYMLGNPTKVDTFKEKDYYFTNVLFAPYGASLLNTVPIMFCGTQTQVFKDTGLRIVVYRTTSWHMYNGVACHEIFKVIEVKLPKGDQ